MSEHIARWMYLSQVIVQRATLGSILSLAVAGAIWSLAAAIGFAPWLRLQLAQVWVAPKMLDPLAHAVEFTLQAEAAVSVGGMRHLIGLRDVPHRDPEGPMRVLETHHPIVHGDEEAEAEKEQREGELDGKPSVDRGATQADIEPEPGGESDCRCEAPDGPGNGKGQDGPERRALHDDL